MLRIEAIKIVINTNTGVFGRSMTFMSGLNIIRANNTSGKSSLFGAIMYGLGFEELLGSRNEKALQSVFKSVVKEAMDGERKDIKESIVTQSEIYLQFSNGTQSITTKRYIANDKIKGQAIEVFYGKLITEPEKEYERAPMYLHDKGGASNAEIGFHRYLEGFIGAELPEIVNQEGKRVKLYLPLVSAGHFIEQKLGWSDFFANMPYYGIRESSTKVFEYILNMDVFDLAASRQEIQNQMKDIEEKWRIAIENLKSVVSRGGGELVGIPESPEILSKEVRPYTKYFRGDKSYLLSELISSSANELKVVQLELNAPLNQNLDRVQSALDNVREQTDEYEILYESLSSEISQERERFRQYSNQLKNVLEDIKKNKDAEKLEKLGLDSNFKIAAGHCPACNQSIQDTLLREDLHIIPMRIDENLTYLDAQKRMIEAFIDNLRDDILAKQTRLASIESAIQRNRQKIRALKKDLTSDDRLPSSEVIERKIILERELSFFYRLREDIEQSLNSIYLLSSEYQKAKGIEAGMSQSYHSDSDNDKIVVFENNFRSLLGKFGFRSKPVSAIKISTDKYTPMYEIKHENGLTRQVDIRFESSASDFIRAQWAYYTSLLKTSLSKSGNHFNTLIFDEPQQQSASTQSLKAFLEELESFNDSQIIVFASFQNSDDDFKEATDNLIVANIVDLAKTDELVIKRIE